MLTLYYAYTGILPVAACCVTSEPLLLSRAQQLGETNLLTIQQGAEACLLPALVQFECQNSALKRLTARNPAFTCNHHRRRYLTATWAASMHSQSQS